MLQWGHGPKAVETFYPLGKLWDNNMLQWGHGPKAVETVAECLMLSNSVIRFNGATARRPWRRLCAYEASPPFGASMGPRPEGRGDSCSTAGTKWWPGASMGPRPEGRGDADVCLALDLSVVELQWGHGPKAVETDIHQVRRKVQVEASMGPRPEGRGDRIAASRSPAPTTRFNGATARRPWRPCDGAT